MAIARTPIEAERLSEAARKALASGPIKMMAARGLAPLPNPVDLITVLYQLAIDADGAVAQAAAKTATELPDRVLTGALSNPQADPRVLDFFAERLANREAMLELILLNPATADETVAELAGAVGERLVDLIASNEQRLLRHPAIIAAMYVNRAARMSTVDRAVELAVRNQVRVPGIAAWDEIARAAVATAKAGPPSDEGRDAADALFAAAAEQAAEEADDDRAAAADEGDERDLPLSAMTIPMKIRLATLGNKFVRAQLVRDSNKMVALAAIKAPGVTEMEAVKHAGNSALSEEVIAYIARKREWTKLYACKLALVNNPKTPLAIAMRLVPHLRDKDIRALARSKSIPSALAAQARKLVMTRSTGGRGGR
ncbi:MAG: hypothetical protein D6689_01500 [Deltaproteobacteria bacterium]|nr:MAG: hypothetical protein D6689_01500 [Deltaproteobacteria bacterium]